MLGEDGDSRITVLSDRPDATFRILFRDTNREPLDILMEDFIDEKSARAKGKRVSTLDIASIEDITPAPEPEPEPEVSPDETEPEEQPEENPTEITKSSDLEPSNSPSLEGRAGESLSSIDIDGVPMTITKPNDTQLDLF